MLPDNDAVVVLLLVTLNASGMFVYKILGEVASSVALPNTCVSGVYANFAEPVAGVAVGAAVTAPPDVGAEVTTNFIEKKWIF